MTQLQKMIRLLFVATMMTALLIVGAQAQSKPFVPKGGGFNDVVKHLEKNYGAKKTKIPMLGLAKFAVWMVRPAGVKGFKLAVFEDQDFSKRTEAASFGMAMRQAFKKEWSPLVQISSKRDGDNHTFIYIKQTKKDVEFALASLAENEAVVLQVKFNPEAAARFLENPKIMGISLGNSVRGNTAANLPSAKPNQTTTAPDITGASATTTEDQSKRIVIKTDNTADNSATQPATRPTLSAKPTDESGSPLSASSNEAAKPTDPTEVKTPPRED
ncbi:MAG: hypothetical protein AAB401_14020, partial [Acidobacteriota bacterium]